MSLLHHPPEAGEHVGLNGLQLHYRDMGGAADRPVVFLHGLMGHAYDWDVMLGDLAADHRVIALDQRGHGRSAWADSYDPGDMAGDVVALVESLGVAPVNLVGHSMGGLVSMLAAAERPDLVRRVVVIDVAPDSLTTEWGRDVLPDVLDAFAAASYGDVQEAVAEWMTDPYAREPLIRHYLDHALVRGHDGRLGYRFDAAHLSDFTRRARADRLWDALENLDARTLIVRGEHSMLLTRDMADQMIRRMKDGSLVEVPGGSHDLGVQQPEAVTNAVRTFLED